MEEEIQLGVGRGGEGLGRKRSSVKEVPRGALKEGLWRGRAFRMEGSVKRRGLWEGRGAQEESGALREGGGSFQE